MKSDAILLAPTDFQASYAENPLKRIFSPFTWFFASLETARHIEREANRLFIKSDADLAEIGLERDRLAAHLAGLA